jgi:hypothetical protein
MPISWHWIALGIVAAAAVILEGLQHLTPERHGRLPDLIEKATCGLLGAFIASAAIKHLLR